MIELTPAERRKAKLRQHIIEQATALYHANGGKEGGFEKTTIEGIAEQSDISLRTFFRYFESKTDVIYLDIKTSTEHLKMFVRNRPLDEPLLTAALNGRYEQIDFFLSDTANKERLLRSLQAPQFQDRRIILRSEFNQCILDFLTEESERGNPLSRSHARIASSLIVDVVADVLDDWALDTSIDVKSESMKILESLPELSKLFKKAGVFS